MTAARLESIWEAAREAAAGKSKPSAADLPRILHVSATDVTPVALDWMYPDRILFRKINLFCGPPDMGKDCVATDLVTRATRGFDWPDRKNSHQPFDVVMLVSEDGLDDTVVPRLTVAGADLARVHFAKQTEIKHGAKICTRRIALDRDLAAIKKMLVEIPARLLVISPLGSYLGALKKNSDDHVRPMFDNLTGVAEETGAAVVAISHFNKNILQTAIDRTGGAGAIAQVPRCAWSFVKDSEDETGESRLMLSVKLNAVKEERKAGLRYKFVEEFLSIDGQLVGYPKIEWLGPASQRIDDVLRAAVDPEGGKLAACVEWLRLLLAGGERRAREVFEEGEKRGFGEKTVRRANARVGVFCHQERDGWWWKLRTQVVNDAT
jgi:hypothetical protein